MTSPLDPHTTTYSHINGGWEELADRLAISEICKGWPVYRDSSEWKNFRSLFFDNAHVWTTWSGPQHIDDFITISKEGKTQGVFIMHRECGTLVELNRIAGRAIGKMKATITQRFHFADPGSAASTQTPRRAIQFDVDCDCRFIFFCERIEAMAGWRARYVKLFYEKDKVVPVDGALVQPFTAEELARYPDGYKFLGAAQARLGYNIDLILPTARNELWGRMYGEMEKWLAGNKVDLFWETEKEVESKRPTGPAA